jgi:multiple sugar transport system ATP-binding protein
MGSLEVRGLYKRLGDREVLKNVNFRIDEGEFFVLLGPSGCGKSTLLRVICGLEQPDQGQIILDGRDVTRVAPRERNLGMVFQDYGLYPNMSVYQNIAYGLEARRMARTEIDHRVRWAAGILGLATMLDRSIVDLSGGEQQRTALARALAKDADAYLFDEPLSNLDPKLRYQARRDIIELHRSKKMPSLYVTHDQTEAFAMADRLAIMSAGVIQQIGTTDEILHQPANTFVATFAGWPPMNLVEMDIRRTGDGYQIEADGLLAMLPGHWNAVLSRYNKPRVIAGFRPQAVSPVTSENGTSTFEARIEDLDALVGESVLFIQVGERISIASVFEDDGMTEYNPGDVAHFALDTEQIRLFDPDNTQSLQV